MFYCGFGGDFCGQSTKDDVNPKSTIVILAFGNSAADGKIVVDDSNFPVTLVKTWQSRGKKVLLSVGGQNGNWQVIFASEASRANFINSLVILSKIDYKIDDSSSLTIKGTSNLHDWVANVNELNGNVNFSFSDDGMINIDNCNLKIDVKSIKSTKGSTMDKKIYKALKSDSYSSIVFQLNNLSSIENTLNN